MSSSSTSNSSSGAHKRVQVCIRVRPPVASPSRDTSVVVNSQEHTISVVTNPSTGAGTCFHFDQVLDQSTDQAGVYTAAASAIVDSVLRGYNGTVLAYGQTGAGKTFTMSGGKTAFEDRGVCARAIAHLFQHIRRDADHAYVVRVSYVEVYNESLYDLLTFNEHHATTNSSNNNNNNISEPLVIQENAKGQTFVRGLSRPVVASDEEALDLLFQGETNRTIAEHCLNASSTRSHCIFTVYVERQPRADAMLDDEREDTAVASKLHLVDLAGSERMKKTNVSGVMMKEATHINKSLTFLEQVVIALGDKKRQHVPYRQTPLTNLLKDSLGGNCHTMLVACVWPEPSHNDQTLATLKFATRMMRVKTSAIVNVAGSGGGGGGANGGGEQVQKYVAEIRRLKEELAMHDTLSSRSLVDYDAKRLSSVAARREYRQQIQTFVSDANQPPPIQNLTQIQQLLLEFRELLLETSSNRAGTPPLQPARHVQAPPAVPTTVPHSESRKVTQMRALRASSPGAGAGSSQEKLPVLAKSTSKPSSNNDPSSIEDSGRLPPIRPLSARSTTPTQQQQQQPPSVRTDKELYDEFTRLDPKPDALLDLDIAKHNLSIAKNDASTLAMALNKHKLTIEGLTLKLQDATSSTDSGTVDPATEFLVLQLKDAKKQYRETAERFQEKKAEVKYLVKIKEQMLQKVTRAFQAWATSEQQQQLSQTPEADELLA